MKIQSECTTTSTESKIETEVLTQWFSASDSPPNREGVYEIDDWPFTGRKSDPESEIGNGLDRTYSHWCRLYGWGPHSASPQEALSRRGDLAILGAPKRWRGLHESCVNKESTE